MQLGQRCCGSGGEADCLAIIGLAVLLLHMPKCQDAETQVAPSGSPVPCRTDGLCVDVC